MALLILRVALVACRLERHIQAAFFQHESKGDDQTRHYDGVCCRSYVLNRRRSVSPEQAQGGSKTRADELIVS